jgi:hypothetical protein
MACFYALDQVFHDYGALPAWISTEDSWLADAPTKPGFEKRGLNFDKFSIDAGTVPRQRQIPPEMVLY